MEKHSNHFYIRGGRCHAFYKDMFALRGIYSNALTTGKGDAHLGTVFYLAEQMGIEIKKKSPK
ncbi:MAG: hypothetical protein EOM31_14575 [Bacteroidia bacterium]|nr:hypothetical protein [Bacteroidia bacterium]